MKIELKYDGLKKLRDISERYASYNIEMAEVTGGTFWKAYTKAQTEGREEFKLNPQGNSMDTLFGDLMQYFKPIDLYNEKLRYLAKSFGCVWVRVSGTWATKTYYDFDGTAGGKVPDGYLNILTKEQWLGVLDFVKAINGKLLISVANCAGVHSAEEAWTPKEAEKIFALSKSYGVPIAAAEFSNEPNFMQETGFPKGYTAAHYRRDQDLFFAWLKANYPDCLCVGPCAMGGDNLIAGKSGNMKNAIKNLCDCSDLMDGTKIPLDVFSYHCYNGISERLAPVLRGGHWNANEATSEDYLRVYENYARTYIPLRDKYIGKDADLWVTESGDAAGGGNTWASTYLDVIRTLNELGGFAALTKGIIFHNTLAASDYGFLERETFIPRPNYFAVLLWSRLMGNTVYDSRIPVSEGAHVYCHSRKDGKTGCVYLVINNSETNATTVILPRPAEKYTLSAKELRSSVMQLNGKDLCLSANNELPELTPEYITNNEIILPPCTCTFFVL